MATSIEGPSLVVGVDFGTTFSGFAYAEVPSKSEMKSNLLNPEPKAMFFQKTERLKIPTELCYCTNNHESNLKGEKLNYRWGEDAEGCLGTPLRFFKLQLDTDAAHYEGSRPRVSTCVDSGEKKLIDLFAGPSKLLIDFLFAMREEFMDNIVKEYSDKFQKEQFRIDWVFTIPSFFNANLVAAMKNEFLPLAGFSSPTTTSISYIREPDAAAIRILSQALLTPGSGIQFKPLDKVLVLDGGGGTTDLFAFEIAKLKVERSIPHIEMEPLGGGSGDTVGAMDINRAFETHLQKVFDVALRRYPDLDSSETRRQMELDRKHALKSFEAYKLEFTHKNSTTSIKRPITLPFLGFRSISEIGVVGGVLELKDEIMMGFFRHVMARIIKLLETELVGLTHAKHNIKKMILVGGLGASPYVQQLMRQWAAQSGKNIEVVTPTNARESISAVMCGAAQHRIQQRMLQRSTVTHLVPKCSYGFVVNDVYVPGKHRAPHYTDKHSGEQMVRNQIKWVMKKGEALAFDETLPDTAIAKIDTQIRMGEKPNKYGFTPDDGCYTYTTVVSKTLSPAELPTELPNSQNGSKRDVVQVLQMDLDRGPYKDLGLNFTAHWRKDPNEKSKKYVVCGSKGAPYWQGTVELSLHLEVGEHMIATSKIKGSTPDFSQKGHDQHYKRYTRWFRNAGW